jgi:hypothetical protein
MHLKKALDEGRINWLGKVFGWPVVIVGYVLDIYLNMVLFTVLLLDPPLQLTVTSRLSRIKRLGVHDDWGPMWLRRWRYACALFMCNWMLEPYDAGHCS